MRTKLLISFALLLFCSAITHGQSSNKNYVMTLSPLSASVSEPQAFYDISNIDIKYFDGLGREISNVAVAASYDMTDVVDKTLYDRQGRVSLKYLPIPTSSSDGSFVDDEYSNIAEEFYGQRFYYSETYYDIINPDLAQKSFGPGEKWRQNNRYVSQRRLFNTQTGDYACIMFEATDNGKLYNRGLYPKGVLRVVEAIDENGRRSCEFTDKAGRKILHRQYMDNQTADTYWVYDLYGRLRYMISPMAATQLSVAGECASSVISRLCYSYEYDRRGRVITKSLPGADPIYYVYDKLNRVVMSQDGVQRLSSQWSVFKFDHKHRPAVDGRATISGANRESLQQQWGDTLMMEQYSPNIEMEYDLKYSVNCNVPNFIADRAYYYDDYSHWESDIVPLPTENGFDNCYNLSAMGIPTGEAVTDYNGGITVTLVVQDQKGNTVLTAERDYWGQSRLHAVFMNYDFRGNMTRRYDRLQFLSEQIVQSTYAINTNYSYDNRNKLISRYHSYNGTSCGGAEFQYDDLGRVARLSHSNALQTDYSYNIRGQLTSQSSPAFDQRIEYESPTASGAAARWDGLIASLTEVQKNNAASDTLTRNIFYDGLGRISRVNALEKDKFNEEYYYDLNGNAEVIVRGSESLYDYTGLVYEGNRLKYTYDETDFDEYWGEIPQFEAMAFDSLEYDRKGRMTKNTARKIKKITYYPCDLPNIITMDPGGSQIFNYRSDGTKTRESLRSRYMKTVMQIGSNGDTTYVQQEAYRTTTRDFYGSFIKQGNDLRYYNEDGYIDVKRGGAVSHRFYERDYLGSVRAVFDKGGNIEQATDYLVTGTPIMRGNGESVDNRLHTGKEFIDACGLSLYDNNARFYSPIDGRFTSIDPLCEKYPDISPYVHCNNNPLSIIDPTGEIVIFINGYAHIEDEAGNSSYWADIDAAIMEYLGDNNAKYYDGSCGFNLMSYILDHTDAGMKYKSITGKYYYSNNRAEEGYSIGMRDAAEIFSSIRDENGNITETIKIITHSMGAAFGKGFVTALTEYMKENDISMDAISFEADFAPFQPNEQTAVDGVTTLQFSHSDDILAGDKQIKGAIYNKSNTNSNWYNRIGLKPHKMVSFKNVVKQLPKKK